jgi:hypothetical protein
VWRVGYPRNNQIFISVRTEINRNSICFDCVSVCFAKPQKYFSVCFVVLNRYQNNRNKQNFFETNQKIPPKTLSNRVSSKQLIFFRFELKQTKTQSVWSFFGLFRESNNFFPFCFTLFRCFRPVSKQLKQTEFMLWGIWYIF